MDVFVYGTLVDPERAGAVLDDWEYVEHAVLHGLYRVDGQYPSLAPGGRVEGRVLRTSEVDRLDEYEGVDSGLYVRVSVPRSDGVPTSRPRGEPDTDDDSGVAVYVGDPDRLDAPAAWPGDGTFDGRVRRYLDESDVVL